MPKKPAQPRPEPEKRKRGRPPKAPKVLGRKAEVDELVAAYALTAFDRLRELCDGAREVKRTYEAAGTLFRKDVVRNADGSVYLDAKGKPVPLQVLSYPDKPADELVLVKEEIKEFGPDVKAVEYMLNRLLGRPAEQSKDDDEGGIDADKALAEAHGLMDDYRDPDEEAAPDAAGP